MAHYNLQICKNSKLAKMKWVPEEQIYKKIYLKEKEIPFYINSTVCVEQGATLRNLFNIIINYTNFFSLILNLPDLESFFQEAFENSSEESNDYLDLSALELEWSSHVMNRYEELILSEDIYFSGRLNDGTNVALELTPINEIIDFPLSINDVYNIYKEEEPFKSIFLAVKPMTLLQVITGIMNEISFFGTPENRNEKVEMLQETIEKLKSGEMKTYSFDEIKKEFFNEEEIDEKFQCRICKEDVRCECFDKPNDICHKCFIKMREG